MVRLTGRLLILLVMTTVMMSEGCTRQVRTDIRTEEHCFSVPTDQSLIHDLVRTEPHEEVVKRLTVRMVKTADAIGVIPFLNRLPDLETEVRQKQEGAELHLLQNNQHIQTMIMLALTEAGHTAGAVRCEQARATELANRLEVGQQKTAASNTTVAVVTSGLTDVAMGVLTALTSGLVLAITGGGGGVLQLPFAFAALYGQDTQEFRHERNVLKDISDKPEASSLFPPSVWAFLNEPRQEGKSLRDRLVERWQPQDGEDKERQEELVLLLSTGGPYTVTNLRRRAALLEELAASIDLMHDDLQLLIREVLVPRTRL